MDLDIIHVQHPLSSIYTAVAEPCVLALGFFDGVHLGHQELINLAKRIAIQQDLKLAVMTFFPHPKQIIGNAQPQTYITPLEQKAKIMQDLGVETLIVVNFDSAFAHLSPTGFIEDYLCGFKCKHAVAGFDFRYGHKGEGNMETLKIEGKRFFEVTEMKKFEIDHEKVSSTKLRNLIAEGRFADIPSFLGTYFESQGTIHSKENQHIIVTLSEAFLKPPPGVYLIEIQIEGNVYEGIAYQTMDGSFLESWHLHFNDSLPLEGKKIHIKWKSERIMKSKQMTDMRAKSITKVQAF
ncbi:FAD synthetase family protein [Bacillus sp. AFS017274]|uniref:FAD synthetase family protein n=1 Tax=Bacillus sp. AFS017274 TaxID=2033488 RepID=UPI000BF5E1B5|nr:FAD synthetase family protein [Bacillus sp. AFS017274]PEZ82104.1 cytidyltransferase [Bacillus sp. AFS017274]